jgi:hypothetical protein
MIAPLLPGAEKLTTILINKIDYVLIDRMNYSHADWVYRKFGLEYAMTEKFFEENKRKLASEFSRNRIPCQLLF